MKTNKLTLTAAGTIFLSCFMVLSYSFKVQNKDWVVPDKYKTMKNPTKANNEVAKQLWAKHCKSCHGKEGLGDGPKAATLKTPAGDFSTKEFQDQSDGSVFYKTKFGKDDMPEFGKKITSDDDLWYLVHYMRTMNK